MSEKLTDAFVDKNHKAGITWDTVATGLGIKVLPTGKKVWVLQTKLPGKSYQSKLTLGEYPTTTLADARKEADTWRGLVKKGLDPKEAKAEEQRKLEVARQAEALKRENTFVAFAEHYIAGRTNRRAKTDAQEIRRMLIPEWGPRPLHEIAARDVRVLIDRLKRHPYDARNAWTHAVGIFKQAVHVELIEVSPCASLDRKLLFKGAKIGPRQRVLNDGEVFAFWRAAGRLGYPHGPFFRLLILTGVRLRELLQARWSELHPDLRRCLREAGKNRQPVEWAAVPDSFKVLTVPRERFKSDAEHHVTLSNEACHILEGLPQQAGCDFLFSVNSKTPVVPSDNAKQRLDTFMLRTLRAQARRRGDAPKEVKLLPFVLHDLRRVVRSNLAALDVADHVAEMVLGHGRKGLQRIYDQHKYLDQIRDALERWAAKLRGIVGPTPGAPLANVVTLRPQGQHSR